MNPAWNLEVSELEGDGELLERRGTVAPARSNRRNVNVRVKKRARRSRSNEVAKRGMHQRRNRRASW